MNSAVVIRWAVAILCFAGSVSPIRADSVQYSTNGSISGFTFSSGGVCILDCGGDISRPVNFNLPQFDPSLGTLQFDLIQVSVQMSGTATLTSSPIACPPPSPTCPNNASVELVFSPRGAGIGLGFPAQFSFLSDITTLEADFDAAGGTAQMNFGNSFFATPDYLIAPFIGTGTVNFILQTEVDVAKSHASAYTIATNASPFTASVTYIYTPSVPEPSFFLATAGALAFLAWRVKRTAA